MLATSRKKDVLQKLMIFYMGISWKLEQNKAGQVSKLNIVEELNHHFIERILPKNQIIV
jgi:hypothetical protein